MKYKVLCTAPFLRFTKVMKHFHEIFDGVVIEYMSHSDLVQNIHSFDGLIPNARILVDEEVLRRADNLKAIYQPSIGYEHIDLDFASSRAIQFNGLGLDIGFKNTLWSTAEHTLSLMLSLLKCSVASIGDVKSQGAWDNRKYHIRDLRDMEIGVIGFGNIGSKVAHLCNAFGARVLAYDPYIDGTQLPSYAEGLPFEELLARSDLVTIHTPLTCETRKLIDADAIGLMKKNALLVNVARGGIVCEEALLEALNVGEIAGVALDVLEGESPFGVSDHPLVKYAENHGNVLITPHLGGSSFPYMESIFMHSIDELKLMLGD